MWLVVTVLDSMILECSSLNKDLVETQLFKDKPILLSLMYGSGKKSAALPVWPHHSPPTFYHCFQAHTHPVRDTHRCHTYEISLYNTPRLLP